MEKKEHPKARWVEAIPVVHDGKEFFYLRDPEGIAENGFVVSREALFLVAKMDGARGI